MQYIKSNSEVFSREGANKNATKVFKSLMRKVNIKNCITYNESLHVFGVGKEKEFTELQKMCIEQEVNYNIYPEGNRYLRFMYDKIMYHSLHYKKMILRNNSIAQLTDNSFITITEISEITSLDTKEKEFIILGKKFEVLNEHLVKYQRFSSNEISKIVRLTNSVVSCYPNKLKNKCLLAEIRSPKFCIYTLFQTYSNETKE